ncbi:hypothetical protein ABZT08_21780 [Streptomyces sp. NPDC005526]|uniref:hypothetical protein n=1 Tax=Streptomyces sp. NPDC005526 TaxID=3156885 RepID=UPI0033B4A370
MSRTEPLIGTAGPRGSAVPAPRGPEADAVYTAVARLEAATGRLHAVLDAPTADAAARGAGAPEHAARAALDEELCDRLVDLAAARAWAAREATPVSASGPDGDAAAAVLRGCTLWTVDADTVRALAMTDTAAPRPPTDVAADGAAPAAGEVSDGAAAAAREAADGVTPAAKEAAVGAVPAVQEVAGDSVPAAVTAHGRAAALVTALASAEVYDAVCAGLRAALGGRPAGRAAAAWEIVDTGLSGLDATREEWVDADPAHTAAGGWVLVDRIGRLALAAALLSSAPDLPSAQAEICVNAARRHTWNHLRQPPPEAATALHLRRTAELVSWITGTAARSGT